MTHLGQFFPFWEESWKSSLDLNQCDVFDVPVLEISGWIPKCGIIGLVTFADFLLMLYILTFAVKTSADDGVGMPWAGKNLEAESKQLLKILSNLKVEDPKGHLLKGGLVEQPYHLLAWVVNRIWVLDLWGLGSICSLLPCWGIYDIWWDGGTSVQDCRQWTYISKAQTPARKCNDQPAAWRHTSLWQIRLPLCIRRRRRLIRYLYTCPLFLTSTCLIFMRLTCKGSSTKTCKKLLVPCIQKASVGLHLDCLEYELGLVYVVSVSVCESFFHQFDQWCLWRCVSLGVRLPRLVRVDQKRTEILDPRLPGCPHCVQLAGELSRLDPLIGVTQM